MKEIASADGRRVVVEELVAPCDLVIPFVEEFYVGMSWVCDDCFDARLIQSGCRYLVCGGWSCEAWHDEADRASAILQVDSDASGETPLVMTTWHTDEPEEEVLSFAFPETDFDGDDFRRYLVLLIGNRPPTPQSIQSWPRPFLRSAEPAFALLAIVPSVVQLAARCYANAVLPAILLLVLPAIQAQTKPPIREVKVQILSSMLTDSAGIGEWGFAAIVEANGHRILFDTGARPETVWRNAEELKVDLSSITDVILSHNHGDHTGGLLTLRREMAKSNPKALGRAYTAEGGFWRRPGQNSAEGNHLLTIKSDYERMGGSFVVHDKPKELFPGAWLTGPVERKYPEKNWSVRFPLIRPDGVSAEDNLPEDSSLILDTEKGLVLISGCGHAGIINTIEYAQKVIRKAPVHAAIGGFHLFSAADSHLDWTASKLKEAGLQNFLGAHCTGIEPVYRIRQAVGLARRNCVVGAVGGGFDLGKGIESGGRGYFGAR